MFAYGDFPVPLIHVDGMQIVQLFVRADGVHIGVNAVTSFNFVVGQGEAFPFGQGMHDFGFSVLQVFNGKSYRAFNPR